MGYKGSEITHKEEKKEEKGSLEFRDTRGEKETFTQRMSGGAKAEAGKARMSNINLD